MTIAVALKVGDGVVLGADSASTIGADFMQHKVYFNAEKIVNLYKGLPIGYVTFGLGSFKNRSTTSLAKDLRELLTRSGQPGWQLNPDTYTVEEAAQRVRRFFFDEHYAKSYPTKRKDKQGNEIDHFDSMGFVVAGFCGEREFRTRSILSSSWSRRRLALCDSHRGPRWSTAPSMSPLSPSTKDFAGFSESITLTRCLTLPWVSNPLPRACRAARGRPMTEGTTIPTDYQYPTPSTKTGQTNPCPTPTPPPPGLAQRIRDRVEEIRRTPSQ